VDEGRGIPCVVYAAKSTEDLHGSIPGQLAECRQAISGDELRQLVGEYSDEAVSGYKQDRGPGLAQALAHAERLAREHGAAELWAQHSDRLARGDGKSARHTVEIALWALKNDIGVRTLQDPDTFRDLLYAVVTGQRNHEDSRRKGLATSAGQRRAAGRGELLGLPPDGYRTVRTIGSGGSIVRRVEFDPDRRPVLELIFRLARRGRNCNQIARTLNDCGHLTKPARARDKPKRFDHTAVYKMLTNLRYSAQSTFGREVLASGDWPGYLTPVQQQGIIDRMVRTRGENRERRRPAANLLAGIGVCGECGGRLRVTASRVNKEGVRRRRYVCANHTLPATHRCAAPALDAEMFETLLLANLKALLTAADPPPSSTIATVEDPERALRDRVRQAAATADDELLDQAIERFTASRDPTGASDPAEQEQAVRELLASRLAAAVLDRETIGRVNALLRQVLITLTVGVGPDTIELAGVLCDGTRRRILVDRAAWIRAAPAGERRTVSHQTWERAEITGTVQAWADEHERSPRTVDWKLGAADRPAARKVLNCFAGDWNHALGAAGLQPVKERRHRWADEAIVAALRTWTVEHGRAPLGVDWLKAAAGRPVTATVRGRFGGWRAALAAAERG
jgi:hypothetical protein